MAGVEHPHPGAPSGVEHPGHVRGQGRGIGDLAEDPDLHVVDEERHPRRVTRLLEGLGDAQPMGPLHAAPPSVGDV